MSHTERTKPADATQPPRQSGDEARLPHERDESTDSQGDAAADNPPLGRQAHDDVERGLVDTARAPEADRAYHEQLQPDPPRHEPRR